MTRMRCAFSKIVEVLRILFSPSFWREFIADDIASESRMLHE